MLRRMGKASMAGEAKIGGLFLLLSWWVLGLVCRQGKKVHRNMSACRAHKRRCRVVDAAWRQDSSHWGGSMPVN